MLVCVQILLAQQADTRRSIYPLLRMPMMDRCGRLSLSRVALLQRRSQFLGSVGPRLVPTHLVVAQLVVVLEDQGCVGEGAWRVVLVAVVSDAGVVQVSGVIVAGAIL